MPVSAVTSRTFTQIPQSQRIERVLDYANHNFPKTKNGESEFYETFSVTKNRNFFDPMYNHMSIVSIINQCKDSLELIYRALGRYGLETYATLRIPNDSEEKSLSARIKDELLAMASSWRALSFFKDYQSVGDTLMKDSPAVINRETGYYAPFSEFDDNFQGYLHVNPKGKVDGISERFGDYFTINSLDRLNSVGIVNNGLFSYKVLDSEHVEVSATMARNAAARKVLYDM